MLLKRLMAALVTAAVLAAMAVPAFAQDGFGGFGGDFLDQDQWCEQFNVSSIDQTQVQNGVTQIGGHGSFNVNYGDVDETAIAKAEPKQTNICAQLGIQDWHKDKDKKDDKDNGDDDNGDDDNDLAPF